MFTTPVRTLPTNKLLNGRNVTITKLGLGSGVFGNASIAMSDEVCNQTLQQAWNSGIRYFDTAPLYGVGLSLQRMGNFLKTHSRKQFALSSKLGFVIKPGANRSKVDDCFLDGQAVHAQADYSYNGIMTSMQQNKDLLQTDYLDLAFVHDLGSYVHKDEHAAMLDVFFNEGGVRAVQELRDNNTVRAIGLGVNEWEVCVEVIERGFIPDCIMLAGRYTLLDQTSLGKFFDLCEKHNISVIVAGVYNSGILSGNPANVSFNYTDAAAEIMQRKENINLVCQQHKVALPQAALQFPLLHPNVVAVVTAARSALEIRQSAERMQTEISPELWKDLKDKNLIALDAPILLKRKSEIAARM